MKKNLRKAFLLALFILLVITLGGCANNNKSDIEIDKYPINVAFTSDWDVRSYNGYDCTDYSTVKNEDGTYTVTFVFTQLPN